MNIIKRRGRSIALTCHDCGHSDVMRLNSVPPVPFLEVVQRLNEAHDNLSPGCPVRYTARDVEGEWRGVGS